MPQAPSARRSPQFPRRLDGQGLVEFGVGVGDAEGAVTEVRPGGVEAHLAADDSRGGVPQLVGMPVGNLLRFLGLATFRLGLEQDGLDGV